MGLTQPDATRERQPKDFLSWSVHGIGCDGAYRPTCIAGANNLEPSHDHLKIPSWRYSRKEATWLYVLCISRTKSNPLYDTPIAHQQDWD